MTITIDLTKPYNPEDIVDELTYRAYYYNRKRRPDIPLEAWGKVFSNVEKLEAKFQKDGE